MNNLAHALAKHGPDPSRRLPVYQQALALSEKTRGVGASRDVRLVRNNRGDDCWCT